MRKIPQIELTQENLTALRKQFHPGGSGPLAVMGYVVGLIDAIANEKGWDVGQMSQLDQAPSSNG